VEYGGQEIEPIMSSQHRTCPRPLSGARAKLARPAIVRKAFWEVSMAAGHRHRKAAVGGQPAGWDDKKVYRRGRTTLDMSRFWCRETQRVLKLMHAQWPEQGLFSNALGALRSVLQEHCACTVISTTRQ
jgi:hypothetical protein